MKKLLFVVLGVAAAVLTGFGVLETASEVHIFSPQASEVHIFSQQASEVHIFNTNWQ